MWSLKSNCNVFFMQILVIHLYSSWNVLYEECTICCVQLWRLAQVWNNHYRDCCCNKKMTETEILSAQNHISRGCFIWLGELNRPCSLQQCLLMSVVTEMLVQYQYCYFSQGNLTEEKVIFVYIQFKCTLSII